MCETEQSQNCCFLLLLRNNYILARFCTLCSWNNIPESVLECIDDDGWIERTNGVVLWTRVCIFRHTLLFWLHFFLIVICCISSPSCLWLHHLQITVRRRRGTKGRLLLCPRLIVFLLCASLDNFFSMHWIFSFGVQLHFFVPLLISLRSSFIIQSDGFFFFCNLCDIIIMRWPRDNGKDACRTTWPWMLVRDRLS